MVDIEPEAENPAATTPPQKPRKSGRPRAYEIRTIVEKCGDMSDKEIAEFLGRSPKFVQGVRKEMKFYKPGDEEYVGTTIRNPAALPPAPLTGDEMEVKEKLERSHLFQSIRSILTASEEKLYIHEYMNFLSSVEDLKPIEETNLHQMIMELIRQDRIVKAEDACQKDPNRPKEDFKKQYHESSERYRAFVRELKASRQQRLHGRQDSSMSLISIIQELNSERGLKEASKEIESIDKEKREWQQANGTVITKADE
jgi:hypothetical protein